MKHIIPIYEYIHAIRSSKPQKSTVQLDSFELPKDAIVLTPENISSEMKHIGRSQVDKTYLDPSVTELSSLYNNTSSSYAPAYDINLATWYVENIDIFNSTFVNWPKMPIGIENWNPSSHVKFTQRMFYNCKGFKHDNNHTIDHWDWDDLDMTKTEYSNMFGHCDIHYLPKWAYHRIPIDLDSETAKTYQEIFDTILSYAEKDLYVSKKCLNSLGNAYPFYSDENGTELRIYKSGIGLNDNMNEYSTNYDLKDVMNEIGKYIKLLIKKENANPNFWKPTNEMMSRIFKGHKISELYEMYDFCTKKIK